MISYSISDSLWYIDSALLTLGRAGVGKSHTANSLYAERVAQVVPFHMVSYTNVQPVVVRKKSQGVVFTAIDTPGLVETDGVSEVVSGASKSAWFTQVLR